MYTKSYKNDVNYFVSSLVYYHLNTKPNCTIEWLAEQINISTSFLNKAISTNNSKHFNVKHLFLIANALRIEPSKLFPSKENYKLLTNEELTTDEWTQLIENYKKRKENLYD